MGDRSARLVAGLLAGVLNALLLQPLEVVKSRLQTRKASDPTRNLAMLRHVWQEGGSAALWSGVGPSIIRLAGGITLYFFFLGEIEATLRQSFGPLTGAMAAVVTFILGALSRCLAMLVFCPFTVLKTRAEVAVRSGDRDSGGIYQQLVRLAKTEGPSGLYAGIGASLLRDVPYSGLNLTLMKLLRDVLAFAVLPVAAQSALTGACSAACATFLTQPADVIRTQQVIRTSKEKRPSALAVLVLSYRTGGVAGIFAGGTARVATRAAQQAITWGVFEALVGGMPGRQK
jgi:solute carrier family 25 protein 38